MEWQTFRLTGQDALAIRASKKLRNDELLVAGDEGQPTMTLTLSKHGIWEGQWLNHEKMTVLLVP